MGTIEKYMSIALGMAAMSMNADVHFAPSGGVRHHSMRLFTYTKSELAAIKKRRKKNKNKKTHRK